MNIIHVATVSFKVLSRNNLLEINKFLKNKFFINLFIEVCSMRVLYRDHFLIY